MRHNALKLESPLGLSLFDFTIIAISFLFVNTFCHFLSFFLLFSFLKTDKHRNAILGVANF